EKWTKQKEFIELCNESKLNLIKQQFVTDDYNNNWKSILAAKFLAL
ncbi:MAG: hypothetical protein RI922_1315, partial [Bacteroidota bacterium]